MQFRSLGRSGLKVSEIGLGSNSFGGTTSEEQSISIIQHALEIGINFIDAADVYTKGRSEEIIGKAIKGRRLDVIIGTKFSGAMGNGPNSRGASRHHILEAVEASLKRLNTDYIDLYYLHRPDRTTPIEETLRTLDDLVRMGKVRYIGCSNFAAWQLCDAQWVSNTNNLEPFVVVQSQYNLLNRTIESELVPCCEKYGVGVVPWAPLASGVLTDSPHVKVTAGSQGSTVMNEANLQKVEKLQTFASERGHKVQGLAISWLLSHPWLSSVIAGATRPDQVTANIASADWKLTRDEIAQINDLL